MVKFHVFQKLFVSNIDIFPNYFVHKLECGFTGFKVLFSQ